MRRNDLVTLIVSIAMPAVVAAAESNQRAAPIAAQPVHPSVAAIRITLHEALRDEALARRAGDNTCQVRRLVELYHELANHPSRDESKTLRQLGLRIRTRLLTVRDHINRQIARSRPHNNKRNMAGNTDAPMEHILAQQAIAPRGAGLAPPARQVGARNPRDFGPDLVDLIERTISPATWAINGGSGAVVYYAGRRALVVSAPGHVHDQVGGVLRQLRAAP